LKWSWSKIMITPRYHIYLILLLFLILYGFPKAISQEKSQFTDTITIHHKYYTTTFSKSRRFPVVVKYWLTKKMLDCEQRIKRSKRFKLDPLFPEFTNLNKDYKHSGYDQGHQMDAFDCGCDSIKWHSASEWLLSGSAKT
jgi:DNA/RNA endonuclease G (NUC1)